MTSPAPMSIRERKRLATRAAIQEAAMRLFLERGYQETTVQQVAEAAGISPATCFRYFPSKEDLVLFDAVDPMVAETVLAQPPELGLTDALLATLRSLGHDLSDEQWATEAARGRFVLEVPELRGRILDGYLDGIALLRRVAAAREGVPEDDPRVAAWAGVVCGILVGIVMEHGYSREMLPDIEAQLGLLRDGLPFSRP